MVDFKTIMKRCQAGTMNYGDANDLHAACYGFIGRQNQEIERLGAALAKVKEWVDSEGWCPICDEHHCREGNCILAELDGCER